MSLDYNDIEASLKIVREVYREAWKGGSGWKTNLKIAQKMLEELRSVHPGNTAILTNLGAVLSDQGQHKKAMWLLLKAANLGSNDRNLFYNIGVTKMNINGERDAAAAYFQKARTLVPDPLTIEAYFDPHGH